MVAVVVDWMMIKMKTFLQVSDCSLDFDDSKKKEMRLQKQKRGTLLGLFNVREQLMIK